MTDRVFGQFRFGKPVFQHVKEGEVSCDAAGGLGVHAGASKDRKGGNVDLCLWARVLAFVFGCLSFQINVVLKRLELDNTAGRLWNFSNLRWILFLPAF